MFRRKIQLPPVSIGRTLSATEVDKRRDEFLWWHGAVGAKKAHGAGITGKGVKIGIIDTGVAPHTDLDETRNVNCTKDILLDKQGHGTHVAGIIAMKKDNKGFVGIAPGVTIETFKALDNTGSGFNSDVARAIRLAVDSGCDVINMSLGGGSDSSISRAVNYAYKKGVILVVASGNESANEVSYPAAYSFCLAVGSVDKDMRKSWFSNAGTALDVVAPGSDILSCSHERNGYVTMSGTSMATPVVSGVVALYIEWFKSKNSRKPTVAEVFAWIADTAKDLGTAGSDVDTGAGLIQCNFVDPKPGIVTKMVFEDAQEGGITSWFTWGGVALVLGYLGYVLFSLL